MVVLDVDPNAAIPNEPPPNVVLAGVWAVVCCPNRLVDGVDAPNIKGLLPVPLLLEEGTAEDTKGVGCPNEKPVLLLLAEGGVLVNENGGCCCG